MAIGDNYIQGGTYDWEETDGDGGEIDYQADLVVEGNVGIGTVGPQAALDVNPALGLTSSVLTSAIIGRANTFDEDRGFALEFKATSSEGNRYSAARIGTYSVDRGFGSSLWTNDPLSQDAVLSFETALNGTLGTRMAISTDHNAVQIQDISRDSFSSRASSGALRLATGIQSVSDSLIFGVHNGDYSWIQAVYPSGPSNPGALWRDLALQPEGGYVGIGVTNPTHKIHLSGGAYCDGTGDWVAGSDRAYKKDIDYDFKYGLKEVEQLKPVYYVHKEDKDNKKQVGFIAQDIMKVIPELVSGDEGALGLSYGQLTVVLVNAVKEQQKEIEELKRQVMALKDAK